MLFRSQDIQPSVSHLAVSKNTREVSPLKEWVVFSIEQHTSHIKPAHRIALASGFPAAEVTHWQQRWLQKGCLKVRSTVFFPKHNYATYKEFVEGVKTVCVGGGTAGHLTVGWSPLHLTVKQQLSTGEKKTWRSCGFPENTYGFPLTSVQGWIRLATQTYDRTALVLFT